MVRWHKAILISMIFHLFVFAFLGTVIKNEAFYQEDINNIEVYFLDDLKPTVAAGVKNTNNLKLNNDHDRNIASTVANSRVGSVKKDNLISDSANTVVNNSANGIGGEGSSTNGADISGSGINKGDGGSDIVTRPAVLKRIKPKYPQFARDKGIEASVILRIRISKNGIPDEVAIEKSGGYSQFDEEAIKAIYKYRFSPAINGLGEAVAYYGNISIDFILRD